MSNDKIYEYEKKLSLIPFFKTKSVLESKYDYEDEIGKGAFGYVMCGYRRSDHCSAAIKVTPANLVNDWYFCQALQLKIPLEVLLLAHTAQIDGVINLIEYGLDESLGEWYIVMERCTRAEDLFEHICSMGFLEETLACQIFRQLIRIIIECHMNGVLHRDIKEENILIDKGGPSKKIWLIDFGSGSLMTGKMMTTYTGTLEYSPPEWVKYGRYKGCQMESWSLGILLYSMVCGSIPFEEEKQIISAPKSLHFPRRDISKECKDLIMRCLETDPECRIQPVEMIVHPWIKILTDTGGSIGQDKLNGGDILNGTCDSGRGSFDEAFAANKNNKMNGDDEIYNAIGNCYCNCISAAAVIGNLSNRDINNKTPVEPAVIETVDYDAECIRQFDPEWNFRVISRSLSPDLKHKQYLIKGPTKSLDYGHLTSSSVSTSPNKSKIRHSFYIESDDEDDINEWEEASVPIKKHLSTCYDNEDEFQFDLELTECVN